MAESLASNATNLAASRLGGIDLRLRYFIPGLNVPPESYPSLLAGSSLLLVSIYTSTIPNPALAVLRIALAPLAIHFFWDHGYGPYPTPANQVSVGLAVIGLYGIMRIIETTFVGLMDESPPNLVRDGKTMPLPTTVKDRLLYSFDLATSLRGTSWFANTHWDWSPPSLLNNPTTHQTRTQFLTQSLLSIPLQVLCIDFLDTLNKSRTWDITLSHPITSLPLPEQLLFSLSVCALTALAIIMPHTLLSIPFVALGGHPASWPPMFFHPFSARTLSQFWSKHWHAIFKRVFSRLSSLILILIPSNTPSRIKSTLRAICIFALSATLHILLMYRIAPHSSIYDSHRHANVRYTFLDTSILKFFLSQPAGLLLESLVTLPLVNTFIKTERRRGVATRIWTWGFMLWVGRYWADVWVKRGLWGEDEKIVGYSVVRGVIYGKWVP